MVVRIRFFGGGIFFLAIQRWSGNTFVIGGIGLALLLLNWGLTIRADILQTGGFLTFQHDGGAGWKTDARAHRRRRVNRFSHLHNPLKRALAADGADTRGFFASIRENPRPSAAGVLVFPLE
jgi:hypothetical protein